jgi:hypothetical protein
MAGYTHERFPSMSEVVYGKSKDTPVPLDMQMRAMLQNTGFSTVPSSTRNAVATAMDTTADAPTADNPALNRPNYPTELAQSQQNMPNGSVKTVYQDSTYPGAEPQGADVVPSAQRPNIQFAQFPQGGGSDFNTVQSGVSGGGGNGLFSPGISSQMQDLYTRSNALLSSRSMVDNWRGRQLAKMRDRMMLSEAAMGNTRVGAANAQANMLGAQSSALRAANEVPLAMMGDYTQQRGQDVQGNIAKMHDSTQRYGIDSTAATHANATQAMQRIHLSDILRGEQQAAGLAEGDIGAVHDTTAAFSATQPRIPPVGKFDFNPMNGGGVHIGPDGKLTFYSQKDIDAASKKDKKNAAATAIYGNK